MSYILDALRKSDKQRQRGTAPTLLSAQATVAAPKQPAFLGYALLGGALLCTGIVIGWLRPWQPEQPVSATAPVAAVKPPESNTVAASQSALSDIAGRPEQEAPAQKATSAAPPPVPTSAVIKQEQPAPARAETHRTPPKTSAAVTKAATAPAPPLPSAGTGTAQDQIAMAMAELPLSIQQEIPGMSIAVHAYSSQPKDRLVSINNRLLREGMSLAPGLTLEQITPDGMVFSYKGYRFSRRVHGSGGTAETR
ncbi:MAG: general secretion pathway protein GspB [Burkholderiales bacterium]|nr:general secretion pathway protein GspB [Burkholderiales bacterium]